MVQRKWTKGTRWANALKDFNSVYLNPFSSASTCAKITDGECTLSAGLRLQTSKALTNNDDADIQIVLFPGLRGCIAYNSTEEAGWKYLPYSEFNSADLIQWRIVSSGVRFLLTNNGDTNEGYFEAVRIPISANKEMIDVQPSGPGVVTTMPVIANPTNLIENPTYVCGRLRDIQKYEFQLKPQKSDHQFISSTLLGSDAADSNIGANNDLIDENFDALYIKISGRPKNATGGGPTQIMCHTCTNLELVYREGTSLARFHTPGARDLSGQGRVQNILQSNMKAARRVIY